MRIFKCFLVLLAFSLPNAEANDIVRITYSCLLRRMGEIPRPFQRVGILEICNDTSIYGEESTLQIKENDYIPMGNVGRRYYCL